MEAIFSASMNSSQTLPTTTTLLGRNPSGAGSQENVILGDCIAGLLRKVSHGEHQRVVHRVGGSGRPMKHCNPVAEAPEDNLALRQAAPWHSGW